MPQFYPMCLPKLPAPPSDAGSFDKLPKELRVKIFEPVIAAGATAITRTSKYLYEDTKDVLASHGVYRMKVVGVNHSFFLTRKAPSDSQFAEIRNVDITVMLVTSDNSQDDDGGVGQSAIHPVHDLIDAPCVFQRAVHNLQGLIECMKVHQSCTIKIARGTFCQFAPSELAGLKFIRQFKTVAVELLSLNHVNLFHNRFFGYNLMVRSSLEEQSEASGRITATLAVIDLASDGSPEVAKHFSIKDTVSIEGTIVPYQYPSDLLHIA